jgi:hypothetical protein
MRIPENIKIPVAVLGFEAGFVAVLALIFLVFI